MTSVEPTSVLIFFAQSGFVAPFRVERIRSVFKWFRGFSTFEVLFDWAIGSIFKIRIEMLHDGWTAALPKLHCGGDARDERQLRAVHAGYVFDGGISLVCVEVEASATVISDGFQLDQAN